MPEKGYRGVFAFTAGLLPRTGLLLVLVAFIALAADLLTAAILRRHVSSFGLAFFWSPELGFKVASNGHVTFHAAPADVLIYAVRMAVGGWSTGVILTLLFARARKHRRARSPTSPADFRPSSGWRASL
jgi:hypothetical protein